LAITADPETGKAAPMMLTNRRVNKIGCIVTSDRERGSRAIWTRFLNVSIEMLRQILANFPVAKKERVGVPAKVYSS